MIHRIKASRLLLVLLILSLVFCFLSCSLKNSSKDLLSKTDELTYRLSIGECGDIPYSNYTRFAPGELNDTCNFELVYYLLSDISIEIDGSNIQLADAIRNDMVSLEQIIMQAKLDAESGIASLSYESNLGLSSFIYRYDNFEIMVTDDVFEAANGNQYHCKYVTICPPNAHSNLSAAYFYEDGNGNIIDLTREDWGISFEIENTNSYSADIKCIQKGGQHFGVLQITGIQLVNHDNSVLAIDNFEVNLPECPAKISNDDSTTLYVNWIEKYGVLSPGTYEMIITVNDVYDTSVAHEFLRKYSNEQRYIVSLTVP